MTVPLVPAPRELERTSGTLEVGAGVEPSPVRRDGLLPPQGYALEITSGGVTVSAADPAGERYARTTLAQLLRAHPQTLPAMRIRDWPDFPARGYMLDVSRDRVPTRATLERLVTLLAELKLNQLQLYTEHTFAYREHETVWGEASPLTHEDMRWLDLLCRENGIELVANQNCFGHLERWLRHERYRHLAEAPDGFELPGFGRRGPSVLAPTDEGLAFVLGLCRELRACIESRWINVGCDETWELGRGKSRDACAADGRGTVYTRFLGRLIDALHSDGSGVQFWGDLGRQHPDSIADLPRGDSVALVWGYEAPVDPGRVPDATVALLERFGWTRDALAGFSALTRPFAERAYPFWVCPGTSSWNSLIGRLTNARANLLDAATAGLAAGSRGYLITDWGDNGHLQPPSASWLPIAIGASLAWSSRDNREHDFAALADLHVWQDAAGEIGHAAELLGDAYLDPGPSVPNASPLHASLVGGGIAGNGTVDAAGIERVLARLSDGDEALARAAPRTRDGELVVRELRQAVRLARHGAFRLARASGLPCPDDATLARDLSAAIEEQRACWLARSRTGGLTDSLARLERPLREYESSKNPVPPAS